jgi:hypothetical protein
MTFLLLCLAGWINRKQQNAIEYLREDVKVLREQLGNRPRFSDEQRGEAGGQGPTAWRIIRKSHPVTTLTLGKRPGRLADEQPVQLSRLWTQKYRLEASYYGVVISVDFPIEILDRIIGTVHKTRNILNCDRRFAEFFMGTF